MKLRVSPRNFPNSRILVHCLLAIGFVITFGSFSSLDPADAQQRSPSYEAEPIGSKICLDCHGDLTSSLKKTIHGRLETWSNRYQSGCESCHGPGSLHAKEGNPSLITNPSKIEVQKGNDLCLECHSRTIKQLYWIGNAHETGQGGRTTCHRIHKFESPRWLLSKRSETELCFQCHTDLRKTLYQRSRHPLREGKMGCSDCHNPHGSSSSRFITARTVNEKCYQCHAEKRGPFLWEHAPSRENCLNCHTAHGSNNEKMLMARMPRLCQQCHIQGRHQTVAGTPNSMWVVNRSCTNCHPQVHGSNHPSGVILQR